MNNTPRIMLAAPASGSGKTTITLALLAALQAAGDNPAACKCGPDYIDPMFHQEILGIPSRNLDLFLGSEDTARALLRRHGEGHSLTVIEGVMGYYDGLAGTEQASSYHLASCTNTPVVLVLPARGSALSLAAMARGFKDFRSPSHIAGLILNNCGPELYARLKAPLEEAANLPLLGYLPHLPACLIESRHLGLVTASEIGDIQAKLAELGSQAQISLDLEALRRLAASAPPLEASLPDIRPVTDRKPRIAVARDKAFCFYYEDNLQLLREFGGELVFFSPLADADLPEQTAALYLGGGYPELYAKELSANTSLIKALREAIIGGLPTFAECGGFMYLQQSIDNYPLVGALPGEAVGGKALRRFGYVYLEAQKDNMLCSAGEIIPAHEFHYWDSNSPGQDFLARKTDGRSWPCIVANETIFAGFPHLYFYGKTELAAGFVAKAAAYGGMC